MHDIWRPHPGPQEEFCERGEFEVLFGGAKGPGKTDCLVADAARLTWHPRYHGLLLRRTYPRLQEIIDRCWALYPKIGGVYKASEHRWYFPPGAKISLGHVQHEEDKRNYHGKEFHYIGFDELTEFTDTQYLFILANVRKAQADLDLCIRATTNPGGVGHVWVKTRFVDTCQPTEVKSYLSGDGTVRKMFVPKVFIDPISGTSRTFVPATVYDNPSLTINDPGYISRLEALPEVERRRLLLGEWDVFEGQAFPELSRKVHSCEPFDIPHEWERFISFDWGYAKPFSVGWWAVDFDKTLYRYREWYGCKAGEPNKGVRMTPIEVARGILQRERGESIRARIADPACWSKRPRKQGPPSPSVVEEMAKEGVYFLKGDNDRKLGKIQFHNRLRVETDYGSDGEVSREYPQLVVFNNCDHFWRTMNQLRLDVKDPEDIDTEQEDHIYDEARYAFMFRPAVPQKKHIVPAGSFVAERNRLIRAKQYARRHGVSLETAYSRLR